ncbi:MAG: hypothetical protein CMK92_06280 [Pseudomonas sp.]|nr:hypothetical protein [Pseudomonas sp.]|tara:strand:- start:368 stop:886 length:519 start_codon:yes stop_codon:yes gene_type:complete
MTEKRRGRPTQHQGEKNLKMHTLLEMQENAQKRIQSGNRVPLTSKLKLEMAGLDPNFEYVWASDSTTNPISLQQRCEAGYTFVTNEFGESKGDPVVQNSKGCNLYLMRVPKDIFQADEREKHAKSIKNYQEIMQVGDREYAGESKELGKGKVSTLSIEDAPKVDDAISLMEG